ncbi:MAG: DUF1571 domain-containing protein [Gemmataceae bacterium]|nr:DUF1571 domain-containing protein [Gemmataceae bacterium]
MYRLLLCLPLCLLLAPERPEGTPAAQSTSAAAAQEPLPEADPVRFLEKCLERYGQTGIKGYSAIFQKQERIGGRLQPSEEIELHVREQPHSVFMRWRKGQRKANAAVYVEGENNNMMLANPTGLAGRLVRVVSRDPEGEDARQSGRYSIKEAGIKNAMQRSVKSWKVAKENGTLRAEYLGVRKIPEAGDRLCYVVRRSSAKPEDDGVREVTLYIDKDTWLQVGSVLKGDEGKLIGAYFFRDIRINPPFRADQFQASALAQ